MPRWIDSTRVRCVTQERAMEPAERWPSVDELAELAAGAFEYDAWAYGWRDRRTMRLHTLADALRLCRKEAGT